MIVTPARTSPDRPIRFSALVGGKNVGRHSLLFRVGSHKMLFDPGLNGNGNHHNGNGNGKIAQHPELEGLEHVFLTHAHTDHIGSIVEVMRTHPQARVWATPATRDLTAAVLKMLGKHSPGQIEETAARIDTIDYHQQADLGDGIYASFLPAGHILGSASIMISIPEGNYLFTGDYSPENRGILEPFNLPNHNFKAIITEGSFVGVPAVSANAGREQFLAAIKNGMEAGRQVVVAANPLSVLQEYAMMLPILQHQGRLKPFPIFINEGLKDSFNIYLEYYHTLRLANDLPLSMAENFMLFAPLTKRSEPGIMESFCYFASQGNLKGDFPKDFVRKVLRNGGRMIYDSKYPESLIRRRLNRVEVKEGQVQNIWTNNHISEDSLYQLMFNAFPQRIVLVHGMQTRLNRFARKLGNRALVPEIGQELDLS